MMSLGRRILQMVSVQISSTGCPGVKDIGPHLLLGHDVVQQMGLRSDAACIRDVVWMRRCPNSVFVIPSQCSAQKSSRLLPLLLSLSGPCRPNHSSPGACVTTHSGIKVTQEDDPIRRGHLSRAWGRSSSKASDSSSSPLMCITHTLATAAIQH